MTDSSGGLDVIDKAIGLGLTVAFGAWAWVVQHFGGASLEALKTIQTDVKELRKTVDVNGQRISSLEAHVDDLKRHP